MTERTVTIKLGIDGGAAASAMLADIIKQRDALLSRSKVNLRLDPSGMEQARQATAAQVAAMRNLSSIAAKGIAPTAQSQGAMANAMQAMRGVSAEFTRQRDLARFWGPAGYLTAGMVSFKSSVGGFLSSAGGSFTGWLRSSVAGLLQYKNVALAAVAAVAGLASVAGIGSMRSQNYVKSVLDTSLMGRKLTNKAGAEKWIEEAQGLDYSAGRQERAAVFQSILSKNPYMNQEMAQQSTESVEKLFASRIEQFKAQGISSAGDLATLLSSQTLEGDEARKMDDIFGLGFSKMNAHARLLRVGQSAGKLDMDAEMAKRPDLVLSNRMGKIKENFGAAMIPALNVVLGLLIRLTDAWGKFSKSSIGAALFESLSKGFAVVANIAGKIAGVIGKTFGAADKAFQKGGWGEVIKSGLAGILGSASPAFKILLVSIDFLKKIWTAAGGLTKLFQTGLGLWQRILDFFSWLLNSIKAAAQWIKDGLGLTKAEKRADLQKAIGETGYKYVEGEYDKESGATYTGWKNEHGDKISADALPANIKRAYEEYNKAPDSVFSKIGEVISGAFTSIKEKFGEVIKPFSDAIKSLLDFLKSLPGMGGDEEPVPDIVNEATGVGKQGDTTTGTGEPAGTGGIETPRQYYSYAPSTDWGKFDVLKGKTVIGTYGTEAEAKQALADISAQGPAAAPPMAVGGSIINGGLIRAHPGEEVSPANVVTGAQTTLERINSMISGRTGGAAGPITITAPPVTINIGRVDKDVDVDRLFAKAGEEFDRKLLFRLRNGLNVMGLRDIGYMRG